MKKEIQIGLMGITAIVILIFGINYLKGINLFKSSNYYYVDFTDVTGVATSGPVFTSGYKIGIVRDLQYNHWQPGHVTVKIEIDRDMKLPMGSTAELQADMLGTVKMNVILNPGKAVYYSPGDTLRGTANKGILGEAADNLLPQLSQLMPKLDSILTSLNQLLGDPALAGALHNTETITEELAQTSRQINRMAHDELPQITSYLAVSSRNMATLSEQLTQPDYQALMTQVQATLNNVAALTQQMNNPDNTVGLLLHDPTLYTNLSATAGQAASLLQDLQTHPKRYVHFSLFGRSEQRDEKDKE